jgi:hypothetical protein
MRIEGKLHDIIEDRFTSKSNVPYLKVIVVIETPLTYWNKEGSMEYEKKDGLMSFEYLKTDYRPGDQDYVDDEFYHYLRDFHDEAKKHESFVVTVHYNISYSDKTYRQNIKLVGIKGRPGEIDRPVSDTDYVDELPF